MSVSPVSLDLSITITAIISVCAIVSPVATAIINNWFQSRSKKAERIIQSSQNKKDHIVQIYENYLSAAGACTFLLNEENASRYGTFAHLAMVYAPENAIPHMKKVENHVFSREQEEASEELAEIASILRKTMQEM